MKGWTMMYTGVWPFSYCVRHHQSINQLNWCVTPLHKVQLFQLYSHNIVVITGGDNALSDIYNRLIIDCTCHNKSTTIFPVYGDNGWAFFSTPMAHITPPLTTTVHWGLRAHMNCATLTFGLMYTVCLSVIIYQFGFPFGCKKKSFGLSIHSYTKRH